MSDNKQIQLSFLFEIPDLRNGEQIKVIRRDMKQYAIDSGFNVPPEIKRDSRISYRDQLDTVLSGEEYFSAWDFGERLISNSERIRLVCEFNARGWEEFHQTRRYQKIFSEIIEYCINKDFYLKLACESPTKPPIIASAIHFVLLGDREYRTIDITLGENIVNYISAQRKKYNEVGPQLSLSHQKFLEEQARKNR